MNRLWKNEIKLMCSRKFILCVLFLFVAGTVLFFSEYVRNEKSYYCEMQAKVKKHNTDYLVWKETYRLRYERLRKDYPGHKAIPEARFIAKFWESYQKYEDTILNLWQDPEKTGNVIRNMERKRDAMLLDLYEKDGFKEEGTGIYFFSVQDWTQRRLLQQKYEEKGLVQDINEKRATGAYVLCDGLKGNSLVFAIICLFVILMNFDTWAKDYDEGTVNLLYTLPFSKKKIYLARMGVHILFTYGAIVLFLGYMFLLGTIRNGTGLDNYMIVNKLGLDFHLGGHINYETLIQNDTVLSIASVIGIESLVTVAYTLFVFALTQLISLLSRGQLLALFFTIVLYVWGGLSFMVSRFVFNGNAVFRFLHQINPINQFVFEWNIKYGDTCGIYLLGIYLITIALVLFTINSVVLRKREM